MRAKTDLWNVSRGVQGDGGWIVSICVYGKESNLTGWYKQILYISDWERTWDIMGV